MNLAETAEILEMRQIMWPNADTHVDPAAEIRVWARMLEPYPVAAVLGVIESFSGEFPPKLPQIREALDPTPTYATALEEFRRQKDAGFSPLYASPSAVPWSHPLIAAFAEAGHWKEWGSSPDGTSDPAAIQSEAAFRAHMRESFKGVAARRTREIAAGLVPELDSQRSIGAGDA